MIVAAIATAIIFATYIGAINSIEQNSSAKEFNRHYAFVVENEDSEFWDEVYFAAYNRALNDGIYLENLRENLSAGYSNVELLRVAVHSSVDGIIYVGSSTDEATDLIDEAVDKGIGVVVLHNDIEQSARQCFVGVNNYELGQMYASQIKELLKERSTDDTTITLLASTGMSEGATNLVTLGIEDALLEENPDETIPEIEIVRIDAEDAFSVEEDIRNLFVSQDDIPNIILCLEGIYTQCVYQAVVDYNHVGEVQIVGYFSNEDILEAIDKQIIYSTVSVDTAEMGKSCIDALEEYNEMGYTNSFMPVNMSVIGKFEAHRILLNNHKTDGESYE